MKLIIDIPEQMYLNAKADLLCGADIIVSAIKNGIPRETVTEFADRCRECGREKVLDKIRAEIKELDFFYDSGFFSSNIDAMFKCNDVLRIIDKYREEHE